MSGYKILLAKIPFCGNLIFNKYFIHTVKIINRYYLMNTENNSVTTAIRGNEKSNMRLVAEKNTAPDSVLLDEWSKLTGAYSTAVLEFDSDNSGKLLELYPYHEYAGKSPAWLSEFLRCYLRITNPEKIRQFSFMLDHERYQTIIETIPGNYQNRRCAVFCFDIKAEEWQIKCVQAFIREYCADKNAVARDHDEEKMNKLGVSVSICSEVNRALNFKDAAVRLVNTVAANWSAASVSFGIIKGSGIRIAAISGVSSFENKMQLLKNYQDTMLEAIDQDLEVVFPPEGESSVITRSAEILCKKHGVKTCLTLPVRYSGNVTGALLLESDQGFSYDDCESLRIMLELVSSRLIELEERSRWIGGRALLGVRKFCAVLLGREYTLAKLLAVIIAGLIVFFIFAEGDYRIDASSVLEPVEKRIVAAPYTSFLKSVNVKPADYVVEGETVLGELDTDELVLQRASVFADQLKFAKEAALAMSEDKTVESQIAEAKAREAAARLALLNLRIEQAELIAPVCGYIGSKEIDLQVGSPLEQGDVLFEILPGDSLEVNLHVGEGDIADILIGQEGEIAIMGYPDRKVGIKIIQIFPVSQLVNERNIFKVKAELENIPEWMKPGMEGLAKIEIGQRSLIWIWTKPVIDWLRIKLWI